MEVFKWLLKNLGWTYAEIVTDCSLSVEEIETGEKGVQELFTPHWHTPKGNCCHNLDSVYSYECISSIEIEDWKKSNHSSYAYALEEIIDGTRYTDPQAFHNASLDRRILAHARARGFKDE